MGGHLVRATLAATASVSVAFGVLLLALPAQGAAGAYATSSAAVALAAAAAGALAGVLAVALFAIAVIYAHIPPLGELHVEQAEDILGLALFVVDGLVVATVVSLVRQRRASSRPTARPAAMLGRGPAAVQRLSRRRSVDAVRPPAMRLAGLVEPLTAREVEVLDLLAAGMSNEEIAASLFVSLNTVKTHLKNVYGKLGVASRTQAAVRSLELGIIGTPDPRDASWETQEAA